MENTNSPGIEGVYEQINEVICSVRPAYRQICPNFVDVYYLFFAWSTINEWVIVGTYENCNETNMELEAAVRERDGSSPPPPPPQSDKGIVRVYNKQMGGE